MRNLVRLAATTAMVAAAAFSFEVDRAEAGGGDSCHRAGPVQGRGTVVELGKSCMNPSVLRVDPGATVTFVNRDPVAHNVLGEGWGNPLVSPDESVTHRFEGAGIYAYACSLHPSMVGAVVVGDGTGSGPVVDLGDTAPVKAETDAGGGATGVLVVAGLSVAAVGGAAVATVHGRRRVRRPDPAT